MSKNFEPSAEILLHSISSSDCEIVTFLVKFHRYILPEFNTHRVFSRNGASSRAIPIKKVIDKVKQEKVKPLYWGKNKKGMSAIEELTGWRLFCAKRAWDFGDWFEIQLVRFLDCLGLHKQTANRRLEVCNSMTMIVTMTDLENFFSQRCHPAAQPEFRELAIAMRTAYQNSVPQYLEVGEWHIPFISSEEQNLPLDQKLAIATGRAARVSYLNHDGKRDLEEDMRLHDRLESATPPHPSPFEHCAEAMADDTCFANFKGWRSYRFLKWG